MSGYWTRTMTRCAAFALRLIGPATEALAACNQADVAGSWQAYSFSYKRGYEPYWVRCQLEVKSNGVIDYPTSSCVSNLGGAGPVFGVLQLIGSQGCIFNGYVQWGGVRNEISRATMNRSKDHLDGVGTFPGGIFHFNVTKP